MRAIEHRLSSRLAECLEDDKMKDPSESDESPIVQCFVQRPLNFCPFRDTALSMDCSRKREKLHGTTVKISQKSESAQFVCLVEDARRPIVRLDHLDGLASSPSEKVNNYGDLPIRTVDRTNRPSSQLVIIEDDDADTLTLPKESPILHSIQLQSLP